MIPQSRPAAASMLRSPSLVTARRIPAWRVAVVCIALVVTLAIASSTKLRAADVTWNNGSASFLWNLTDLNWSTGAWNNANGDGAIFGATGVGAINVTSAINVNSLEL